MEAPRLSRHSLGHLACRVLERVREENWGGWGGIRSLFVGWTGASLGLRGGRQVRGGTSGFASGTLGSLWDRYEVTVFMVWRREHKSVHSAAEQIMHANGRIYVMH